MRPVAHAHRGGAFAHLFQVAFQRIQIQHQTRGLNVGLVHARQGRHVKADVEFRNIGFSIH